VCTRLENGRTYLRQWPIRELKLFAAQLKKEDELAVEATGNTRLFYDAVEKQVARVVVVNPSQFKVISQSVKKTDKNDAELLALYLAKRIIAGGTYERTQPKRDGSSVRARQKRTVNMSV
jgi:transposase